MSNNTLLRASAAAGTVGCLAFVTMGGIPDPHSTAATMTRTLALACIAAALASAPAAVLAASRRDAGNRNIGDRNTARKAAWAPLAVVLLIMLAGTVAEAGTAFTALAAILTAAYILWIPQAYVRIAMDVPDNTRYEGPKWPGTAGICIAIAASVSALFLTFGESHLWTTTLQALTAISIIAAVAFHTAVLPAAAAGWSEKTPPAATGDQSTGEEAANRMQTPPPVDTPQAGPQAKPQPEPARAGGGFDVRRTNAGVEYRQREPEPEREPETGPEPGPNLEPGREPSSGTEDRERPKGGTDRPPEWNMPEG